MKFITKHKKAFTDKEFQKEGRVSEVMLDKGGNLSVDSSAYFSTLWS